MDMRAGHVAGDRQALRLGGAHHGDAFTRRQAGQVNAGAGFACQQQNRCQRHGFCQRRNACQAQTRGHGAVVRNAIACQRYILRAQPQAEIECGGVLHGAQQHLRVGQRCISLGKGAAPCFGQLGHLGQHFAFEFLRQRADRVDARARQVLGTEFQHFHQAGLVQRRVGVGRARQRRDPACGRREHFGFERGAIFKAGFAQPHRQIDQPGANNQPAGVDGAIGVKVSWRIANGNNLPGHHKQIGDFVTRIHRVDHTPVPDMNLHASASVRLFRVLALLCRRLTAFAAVRIPATRGPCLLFMPSPLLPAKPSPPSGPQCRRSPAAGSPTAARQPLPNRFPRRDSSDRDA